MEDTTSSRMVREARAWLDPDEDASPPPAQAAAGYVLPSDRARPGYEPMPHEQEAPIAAAPSAPGRRSVTGLWVAVAVALVGAGLVAFTLLRSGPETMPIFEVGAGTCFLEPEGNTIGKVQVVDCTQTHDLEAFAVVPLPFADGGALPDDETLFSAAYEACLPHFPGYTGEAYETSPWWIDAFVPDRRSWKAGDRQALCVLFLADDSGYVLPNDQPAQG